MALRTPTKSPKLLAQPPSPAATPPLLLNFSPTGPSSPPHTNKFSYDGITCEFLKEPPQKFVCSICTQLVKDPHLTACCGHEFCENCLQEWENKSRGRSCPHCRHEDFLHILDKQTRREVEELEVLCPKKDHGCQWKGELRVAKAHERDCEYTLVKCHNCSMSIPRKNFEKHLTSECAFRESKCVYCNQVDAYMKVISFVHLAECPGYPMGCPNNCGTTNIKRSEITAHRESCPLEEIHCPLKSAGCPRKLLRKDLEAHVASNQTQHLLQLMTSFQKSQQELETQQRELRELKMFKVSMSEVVERVSSNVDQLLKKSLTTELTPLRSIRALLGSGSGAVILNSEHKEVSLVLPNFSQLEKKVVTSWESVPFFLGPGYKVRLAFIQRLVKSNELAAEVQLLRGEFDDKLPWPCTIDFTNIYMFILPVKDGNKSDIISLFERLQPPFSLSSKGKGYGGITRCPSIPAIHHVLWHTEKVMDPFTPYPSALRSNYLQNDCLTISLTWGPPHGMMDFATNFSNLSLEKGKSSKKTTEGAGGRSEAVREGGIAVSTSSGGDTAAATRVIRRSRGRRK